MKEDVNKLSHSSKVETRTTKITLVTITAIFAALITVMTAYICHIPVPITGGYIHVGDSMIFLAAAVLPKSYAMIAGAIGGGMADLLTAPMWVIPTIIIKMLITIPFSHKGKRIVTKQNIIAVILAYMISAIGYYLASTVIYGSEVAFLTSISASAVQGLGSGVIFIISGIALDNIKFKRIFLSEK